MFHRTRQVLAPFASSSCAHLLLSNCAVWPPWSVCPSSAVVSVVVEVHWGVLGKLCGGFLAHALARCLAQISAADSLWFPPQHLELDHQFQLPPREISTWRSTLPKSALRTLTNLIGIVCFFFMLQRNIIWSANLWRTRNLRMSANMSGENSVQMMTADVNLTRANVFHHCGQTAHATRHRWDRTHHVASNMARTSAPSTKNFLRDV